MNSTTPLVFTRHGHMRSDSRRVSRPQIRATLRWGRRYYSFGDRVYRLDRRSVAKARERGVRLDDFEGTTVVVTPDGTIRTCWKNRNPSRIRR